MILSGKAIADAVERGDITIDPFDPAQVNPNSYNYRLGPAIREVTDAIADPKRPPNAARELVLPKDGYVLRPDRVYLGATLERIGSPRYVASLIGRSSMGRLGVFLQISADLGQLGSIHRWTLEIVVAQPIRIYPGMRIGQVSFWMPRGATLDYAGLFGHLDWANESHPAAFGVGAVSS